MKWITNVIKISNNKLNNYTFRMARMYVLISLPGICAIVKITTSGSEWVRMSGGMDLKCCSSRVCQILVAVSF